MKRDVYQAFAALWSRALPPAVQRAVMDATGQPGPTTYRDLFTDPVRSAELTDTDYVTLLTLDRNSFADVDPAQAKEFRSSVSRVT